MKPDTHTIRRCLSEYGYKCVADVQESERAQDLAFVSADRCRLVLRCVPRPEFEDYRALETMLRQGDFERAALAHCEGGEPSPFPGIQTCSLDNLPTVLARWANESAPS